MSDINNVFISGRLGADPVMRYFETGSKIVTISIGVNKWNKKAEKEVVTWHNCKAWGTKAEFIAETAKKGAMLFVSGTLEKDVYKDANGNNCATTYILINEVKISIKGD